MGITSSTLSITFPTLTCFGSSISFISSYPKMSHQFGGQIGGVSLLKINSDPLIPGTNTIPCMVFPHRFFFSSEAAVTLVPITSSSSLNVFFLYGRRRATATQALEYVRSRSDRSRQSIHTSLEVFDEDPPRLSNGCWSSSAVQTSGGSGVLGTCNHVSPNINATASTALDVHLCQGVALASNDRA